MKIGLVCPYDMERPGGVQDQVARLARWLRAAGHTVGMIAPGEHDDDGFVSVGTATVIPANGAATPIALAPDVARRVATALEEFDVVHIHEPLMPQVSLGALRHTTRPTVGTFHADVTRIAGYAYSWGRPLTGRWIRKLDVITAVSPLAARVVDYTGRVRIIPNGIDVDDYTPPDVKDADSVVFLGRNDARKGLPVLLDAWPKIRAEHPGATLTVLGAEAAAQPMPGVTFAGRVSETEKQRQLGAALVYCAPNLGGESFGIVVAEGMAAGCAVVASALPAFVRVLGGEGVFVAPGDAGGLAGAINSLLASPESTKALGARARVAVRRFDGSVVGDQYVAAYEDAIRSHAPA